MNASARPPVYTLVVEWLGWSLDRTASLPRSHRFTFGERVDRLTLDCMERVIEAVFATPDRKAAPQHARRPGPPLPVEASLAEILKKIRPLRGPREKGKA